MYYDLQTNSNTDKLHTISTGFSPNHVDFDSVLLNTVPSVHLVQLKRLKKAILEVKFAG